MGQGVDPDVAVYLGPPVGTGQGIYAVDVHRAGSTDAFSTGTPKDQRGVHFIFDLEERVEHHGRASTRVHVVGIEPRVLATLWIVAIDTEALDSQALGWCWIELPTSYSGVCG